MANCMVLPEGIDFFAAYYRVVFQKYFKAIQV